MTTASGTREIPFPRRSVWRALTAMTSYCPVCDVSYVFSDGAGQQAGALMGLGTRFVCVQGRLDGAPPPQGAVTGEVVDWVAQECIGTRLDLRSETWRTRIELADVADSCTRVTVTVTHGPTGGNRLLHVLQRTAMQRMVQRTVDSELGRLPDHVRWMAGGHGGGAPVEQGTSAPTRGVRSSSVEREHDGWVIHLRGEVDAPAVERLELQRHLEELAVRAVDVRDVTYVDSSAFPPLQRWARNSSRAGGRAVIRGENRYVDEMLAVMGLTSAFLREN